MDGRTAWCQCGAERLAGLATRGLWVIQASHFVQNKVSVRLPSPSPPSLPPLPATRTSGVPHDYISKIKSPSAPSLSAQYGQQAITELTSRLKCSVADSWIDHTACVDADVCECELTPTAYSRFMKMKSEHELISLEPCSSSTTEDIRGSRLFPGALYHYLHLTCCSAASIKPEHCSLGLCLLSPLGASCLEKDANQQQDESLCLHKMERFA